MNNVEQVIDVHDEAELKAAIRARQARNAIGHALGRAYPKTKWLVSISGDGTVAQIMAPEITQEFGMVLRVNQINLELEQKAVRFGGELLERFNVSRTRGETDHVVKNIRGDSIHGSRGGV